ncbi:hypothetical protein ACIRVI_32325 [[Kitasatospora] papulosa]|uniref:hypothetical protein n=1 Tax=[Kitasatospora] papulosa TaxID=1464011 RepID=UPI0037F68ABF
MTTEPSRARAGEVQHGLGRLLSHLQESGDDLVAEGEKQRLVVEFVRDLQARARAATRGAVRPPRAVLSRRPRCAARATAAAPDAEYREEDVR